MEFSGENIYDTSKSAGIFKKTASNQYFTSCFPDFTYSEFDQKLAGVINWFCQEYEHKCPNLKDLLSPQNI